MLVYEIGVSQPFIYTKLHAVEFTRFSLKRNQFYPQHTALVSNNTCRKCSVSGSCSIRFISLQCSVPLDIMIVNKKMNCFCTYLHEFDHLHEFDVQSSVLAFSV